MKKSVFLIGECRLGRFLCLSIIAAALPLLAMDATSADNLAQSIIAQLGRAKGVTSIPNCGNGQLVRAFLAASGMKVHAKDSVQANVDATRQLIEPMGKIGPVCTIDKGTLSTMPYVNRFVDCIVITNLSDADLAKVPYAEIQRVLAPDGLAFIGRASAEGSGITQTALQNWIDAAAKSRSTAAISTSNGLWAVVTGQELHGVDVWPRHNYDSAGTNYSKDSVASFPWLPQAKMKPYQQLSEYFGLGTTTVTSGGRLYELAQETPPEGHCTSGACPPNSARIVRAYSIYNGELLWERNVTNDNVGSMGADPIRAYGRDVYLMRTAGGILQLNGITGAEVGTVSSVPADAPAGISRPTNGDAGCGPMHSSVYYNFNGTGNIGWDFTIGKARAGHYYKPSCGILGTIVSNGMMIFMRPSCTCGSSRLWGSHILGPAGSFQFDRSASSNGAERIEQGPAYGAIVRTIVTDNQDWATHRGNLSRTGGSPVAICTTAAAVHRMWNCVPPHNYVTHATAFMFTEEPEAEPTPPVTAGSYSFIAGTDGYVRCLNSANGSPVWSYLTGGRIYGAPTIWNGCVYVGSVDGYAYCLEAHTGRLVWRFRAAPVDMRFNLYGYLSSVWPILGGVMVDANGNAYFTAGVQSEFGTHIYCVNASTGALKWQNNNCGTALNKNDRLGVYPCGYMTIARNRLLVASSSPTAVAIDTATGIIDSTIPQFKNFTLNVEGHNYIWTMAFGGSPIGGITRGREVGVVGDAYFITGGYGIFRDPTFRRNSDWTIYDNHQFYFNKLNASGTPQYPTTAISANSSVTSAWDASLYYHVMAGDRRLECYRTDSIIHTLDGRVSLPGSSYAYGTNTDIGIGKVADAASSWMPATLFSETVRYYNAMVLAANALVATYTKADPKVPEAVQWYVGALDRTTGNALWEIALPDVGSGLKGAPLHQGLAIDRSGNIIVTLYNGNVLCYGTGPATSVARVDLTPQPPLRPARGRMEAGPAPASPIVPSSVREQSTASRQTQVTPATSARGVVLQPTSPVQLALEAPAIESDASDMVTSNTGASVHGYPPSVRTEMVSATVGNPVDMTWKPGLRCLEVASVTATSASSGANNARNTLDRDLRTRWSPADAGEQWLTYDLGTVREVSSASIVWFNRHQQAIPFTVALSVDGKKYHGVDNGTIEGVGTGESQRAFLTQEARFVRISFTVKPTDALPVVEEVGIHGGDQRTSLR
jgi:outer membrane protein assembly factor BamB